MAERSGITDLRFPDGESSGHRPACTLYETCLAPLCPLDPSSLKGIWYPDEEICRSRSQGGRPWIKAQRRIAKVAGSGAGYFTLEMLGRLVVIRKGIAGLDPDLPEEQQLRAWFQKRPERRGPSSGDKTARARHLRKFSFRKKEKGWQEGVRGWFEKGSRRHTLTKNECRDGVSYGLKLFARGNTRARPGRLSFHGCSGWRF